MSVILLNVASLSVIFIFYVFALRHSAECVSQLNTSLQSVILLNVVALSLSFPISIFFSKLLAAFVVSNLLLFS